MHWDWLGINYYFCPLVLHRSTQKHGSSTNKLNHKVYSMSFWMRVELFLKKTFNEWWNFHIQSVTDIKQSGRKWKIKGKRFSLTFTRAQSCHLSTGLHFFLKIKMEKNLFSLSQNSSHRQQSYLFIYWPSLQSPLTCSAFPENPRQCQEDLRRNSHSVCF